MIVYGMRTISRTILGPSRSAADLFVADTLRDLPPGGYLGSVLATPDGDLMGATSLEGLRQRVNRMMGCPSGAYAHLNDWGMKVRRGSLMHPSELRRAQIQATEMLLADPDISAASVVLSQNVNGARRTLFADISVTARFGGTISTRTGVGS